jgi:hypothetical protein
MPMTYWGNQHASRKRYLLGMLHLARKYLDHGAHLSAQLYLNEWRKEFVLVPASTRRRWKCGR